MTRVTVSPWQLVHGSCVLTGPTAILIRGASGSGKSTLAIRLLDRAVRNGRIARLVADDQLYVTAKAGAVIARTPAPIHGLIEMRGFGLCRLPVEPLARIGLIVDIIARSEVERLPEQSAQTAELCGLVLPRQQVPAHDAEAVALIETAFLAIQSR